MKRFPVCNLNSPAPIIKHMKVVQLQESCSSIHHQQLSINELSSPTRRRPKWPTWILSLDQTPSPYQYFHSQAWFRDTPNNSCNSCKLVDYSSPWFSWFGFPRKNPEPPSLLNVVITALYLHSNLSCLWCGSTVWSFAVEISTTWTWEKKWWKRGFVMMGLQKVLKVWMDSNVERGGRGWAKGLERPTLHGYAPPQHIDTYQILESTHKLDVSCLLYVWVTRVWVTWVQDGSVRVTWEEWVSM